MGELFKLTDPNHNKQFTLPEAQDLLPIIRRVTIDAAKKVETLQNRIKGITPTPEQHPFYTNNIQKIINRWADKVRRLGAIPKGLWTVDFNNGDGFYCWHYPEGEIEFFHEYNQAFPNRVPIL